jgi:hypothetical protein
MVERVSAIAIKLELNDFIEFRPKSQKNDSTMLIRIHLKISTYFYQINETIETLFLNPQFFCLPSFAKEITSLTQLFQNQNCRTEISLCKKFESVLILTKNLHSKVGMSIIMTIIILYAALLNNEIKKITNIFNTCL